jgi:UPF0716 protein FxsA
MTSAKVQRVHSCTGYAALCALKNSLTVSKEFILFFRLFLLFTLVPAIELYLIIRVGSVIGALNTILIIIFTGILGAYYAREQGFKVISNIQAKMQMGTLPGDDLVNGAMLLVGGALLVTPGFITDFFGFSLIFPPTREAMKVALKKWIERKTAEGQITVIRDPGGGDGGPYIDV